MSGGGGSGSAKEELDPFVQRQLIDEQRRKQQREDQIQLKAERDLLAMNE